MEYGGLVVVLALVVALAVVPHLIARRTAIMESREGDRFSPRMRMLSTDRDNYDECVETSPHLLTGTRIVLRRDIDMATQEAVQAGRTPRVQHRNVREIAALRARRAARRSAEAAAGRRRMLAAVVSAAATPIVAIVVAATSVTWPWLLIPAALCVASLAASRYAAVRSQQADAREKAELQRLRGQISDEATAPSAPAPEQRETEVASTIAEAEAASDRPVDAQQDDDVAELVAATREVEETEASASDLSRVVPSGEVNDEAPTGVIERVSAPVERRTWTPAAVPAPSYAMRGRVMGRVVHPDTDIRGIPRVEARVPARPIEAAPMENARSTEEVVESTMVALDLDAVLQSRIAQ